MGFTPLAGLAMEPGVEQLILRYIFLNGKGNMTIKEVNEYLNKKSEYWVYPV